MVVLWARLTLLAILAGSTAAVDPRFPNIPEAISPAAACEDFAGNDIERPSWSLADCQGVWAQWSSVLPQHTLLGYMDRRLLQQTAEHLRREGLQCFVQLPQVGDGVGSSAIRSIITWMFAEEIGCNWAIPDWGRRRTDAQGRSKYCHAVTTTNERANMTVEERRQAEGETCIYVNWLQYFGFDRHSVPLPEQGIAKTVVLSPGRLTFKGELEAFRSEMNEIVSRGPGNVPWDYLVITFIDTNGSSRSFLSANSWDAYKRRNTRHIHGRLKETFHGTQRQSTFDASQQCGFDNTRLNFGIHIRMGDRRQFVSTDLEYFRLLDAFMNTVTAQVQALGLPPPIFHVFSETSRPCPSRDTGVFEEFSAWPPVEWSQIEPCWNAAAPTNCPEKEAGLLYTCRAPRSGVFRLQGKALVLHVGTNVVQTMSCMIHADGVLMGCSTFGQVAGILSKGISFFSLQCGGDKTPDQYLLIPPMAVAELGKMWVPVDGSWRDPVLWSEESLTEALVELVKTKESLVK